uniref:RNA-directed RNA polymerase L n=1 Tax=Kabuto mountain virus TaxID=1851087 RepID=A0A679CAC1_9VIRU|nr:RNA-dependent RNA polymerase [Kabuto mountain virus]
MLQAICSRTPLDGDFTCPPSRTYRSLQDRPSIPTFLVRMDGSDICITFDLSDITSASTGSSLQPEYKITKIEASTFIHDFTFAHLAPQTDVRLKSVFPTMGDTYDGWTPDYICKRLDGSHNVVEFTTNRSPREAALFTAFNQKVGKYEIPLKVRSQVSKIFFAVIAVGDDLIISNLELNRAEVEELCFRFILARAVFAELLDRAVIPEFENPDEDKHMREVRIALSDIKFKWEITEERFHPFTRQLYEHYQNMTPDTDWINQKTIEALDMSGRSIFEDHYLHLTTREQRLERNRQVCLEETEEWTSDFNGRAQRSPLDHKSTICAPAIIPVVSEDTSSLTRYEKLPVFLEHEDSTGKLWTEAFYRLKCGDVERAEEDVEAELHFAMTPDSEQEQEAKKLRQKFHRVRVSLPKEDWVDIAQQGVEAKSLRNHPVIERKREVSKRTFPLTTLTDDIESFFREDGNLFSDDHEQEPPAPILEVLKTNAMVQEVHGIEARTNPWFMASYQFLRRPLGIWLVLMCCIATELCLSLKQHCPSKTFILKKLRFFDIFLIIKPTNSASHVFWSLAFPNCAIKGWIHTSHCFKATNTNGTWHWTEFVSHKMSKLTNLVKVLSTIFNCNWFWQEFYEVPFWIPESHLDSQQKEGLKRAREMLRLCLMVMLEDKARTEEIVTATRYVYMEGFVSHPLLPKPQKMLKKLPEMARTKLQVWLLNKVTHVMQWISGHPFRVFAAGRAAEWTGIVNMYSWTPITTTQKLISLFYLGYLKNKEESPERNATVGMYKKILEYEDLHPGRYDFLGLGDPDWPDIKFHEYSISLIKFMSELGVVTLRQRWGDNILSVMWTDFLEGLASLDLEKIATLKASSNFGPEWYEKRHDGEKYHRTKVLQRVAEYVDKGKTYVFEILKDCLETVENRGHMHVCLFKKPQHGGLREIYVLGFEERVVQLVIESLARQVCKRFKSETMMNPKNKLNIPENHGLMSTKICGSQSQTVCASADAQKWNQGHHVTKFALMLCTFYPESLHPFIMRACSLFMRKRIMIDQSLLDLIDSNLNLQSSDEYLMKIHSVYHGRDTTRWMEKGGGYIQTETGMMQGILHYTSSLFHTIYQEWLKSFFTSLIRSRVERVPRTRTHVDVLQSSDDSGVMISFPAEDPATVERYRFFAATCFIFKGIFGRLLGIYSSVKTTNNTLYLLEFNSEFFFHMNHNRPLFRWIAACDVISEQESLAARQEEMYNNLTAVVEGGGSFSLAGFCQFGQSLLHYNLLGMTISSVFLDFLFLARRLWDPSLGLFLLDSPYAAGLAGFKYNLWVVVCNSPLGKKYRLCLERISADSEEEVRAGKKTLDTTQSGTLLQAITIRFGDWKKWKRLVESLNLPSDWLERLDQDPEVLYRRPRTPDEVKLKIAEKVHSPGVSSSLSRGNAVVRIISASVYILTRSILTDSTAWMMDVDSVKKKSLLLRITESIQKIEQFPETITLSQVQLLFPLQIEYERLRAHLTGYTAIGGAFYQKNKVIIQTKINVLEIEKFQRGKPEDLVADKWFGFSRSKMTPRVFSEAWDQLQATITWISESPEVTLAASPFLHHSPLRNFLSRLDLKGREIRIVGAPIKKSSGVSNISTAIRDNFFPKYQLTYSPDEEAVERSEAAGLLKHCLFLVLVGPYTDTTKISMVEHLLTVADPVVLRPGQGKTRTNTLALLQTFYGEHGKDVIFNSIEHANCGVIGGFSHRQKSRVEGDRILYFGDGVWRGLVDGFQVQITVFTPRNTTLTHVKSIEILDEKAIRTLSIFLRNWCDEMEVYNKADTSDLFRTTGNFYVYDFNIASSKNKFGAPIFLAKSTIYKTIILDPSRLTLAIHGMTINLVYQETGIIGNYNRLDRRFHVLSYTGRDTDVTEASAKLLSQLGKTDWFPSKEPTFSWMTMRALPISTVDTILSRMESNQRIPGFDFDKLRVCLKDILESSLRRRGLFLSPLAEAGRRLFQDEVDLAGFMQWGLDDDFINQRDPVLDIIDELSREVDEEILDLTDLGPMGLMEVQETLSSKYYHHRLLDLVVDEAVRRMGVDGLRELVKDHRCLEQYREIALRIFRIMGLNEEHLVLYSQQLPETEVGLVAGDDDLG